MGFFGCGCQMTAEALFTVEEPAATGAPVAAERVTEAAMVELLVQRYTRIAMNAHRYAFADHVPDKPGFPTRVADFIAMDCYTSGGWPDRQHRIHGHEVKVSRSDWLTELKDPEKAEAFRPYCHHWWLVVSSHDIVKPGELPEGWGLLAKTGGQLRAVKRAPLLTPEPMPGPLVAAFARAVAKSARKVGAK